MNNLKIAGGNLPDMPWEDRPAGSKEVLWRYTQNPIIGARCFVDFELDLQFGGGTV